MEYTRTTLREFSSLVAWLFSSVVNWMTSLFRITNQNSCSFLSEFVELGLERTVYIINTTILGCRKNMQGTITN